MKQRKKAAVKRAIADAKHPEKRKNVKMEIKVNRPYNCPFQIHQASESQGYREDYPIGCKIKTEINEDIRCFSSNEFPDKCPLNKKNGKIIVKNRKIK